MNFYIYAGAAAIALAGSTALADGHAAITVGEGNFSWDSFTAFADSTDLSSQTVTITGPWTGNEKEQVEKVFALFTQATGATVNYSGSDSFEQDILISARAGSAPNLAVFPNRGLRRIWPARGC